MSTSFPLVSVVMPVFNAEKYLPSAVRSILRQDYPNIELIAINDGSSDRSEAVLAKFARDDPRLRVISRENRGVTATLNQGLALARGDLIARMDADDISYPRRLSLQVSRFQANPRLALCGCHYDTILFDHKISSSEPLDCVTQEELAMLSLFFTMLLHPTVMFRRSVIGAEHLTYDDGYPFAEDFELFRRIAREHPVELLRTRQLAYRVHPGSVSATRKSVMRRTHLRIVEENFHRADLGVSAAGVAEIAEVVSVKTVTRAAKFIRELDGLSTRDASSLRAAVAAGANNLFYFFFDLIKDCPDSRFIRVYLDLCNKWHCIRRREVLILKALPLPGLEKVALRGLLAVDRLTTLIAGQSLNATLKRRGAMEV